MAADSYQANSADAVSPYIARQLPNRALENAWPAWVSLQHRVHPAHLSMCLPLQVPPVPANNQREDIPPPRRGVAEPGRMQDLHHVDVAYQGIVDYRPQPLAVSNFHLLLTGLSLINDTRAIVS